MVRNDYLRVNGKRLMACLELGANVLLRTLLSLAEKDA